MHKLALSLLAASTLAFAAGCPTCDDVAAAADACYEEAGLDGEFSCTGTPPADIANCQIDVYESADCSSSEGVLDADSSANSCALSVLF